ncbi:MAG: hypothetical protein Q7T98_06765, partial [Polaromonas sp.]|nr:hypothetical protein [Polaromonas sp.]
GAGMAATDHDHVKFLRIYIRRVHHASFNKAVVRRDACAPWKRPAGPEKPANSLPLSQDEKHDFIRVPLFCAAGPQQGQCHSFFRQGKLVAMILIAINAYSIRAQSLNP